MSNTIEIIVIIFALVGVILSIGCILYFAAKVSAQKKMLQAQRRPSICLKQVLEYKVQMREEEASNHELDSTKPYFEKIDLGTAVLNEYKNNKGISISEYYRMG